MVEISPFYKKKYLCPLCKMEFTSLAVRSSKINLVERETDFHPVYRGPSPLHYSIIVCPLCNYATSVKNFDLPLSEQSMHILAVALQHLSEKRADLTGLRNLEDVLQCMEKAINIATLKQDDEDRIASLYLYKGWIAREIGNADLEESCLNDSLDKLYYVFNHHSSGVCVFNDVQLTYLLGELNLRLGVPAEAVQWFAKTVNHRDIKSYPQIEKLTRDRWSDARDASFAMMHEDNPDKNDENESEKEAENSPDNIDNNDKIGLKTKRPSLFGRNKRPETQIRINSDIITWLEGQIDPQTMVFLTWRTL